MTVNELYAQVRLTLAQAAVKEPDAKARVIVSEALDIGLGDVFLPRAVSADAKAAVEAMTQRCAMGEPVEYVTGRAYFRYNVLHVSPDVLIPRQETELVVQEAIDAALAYGYKTALDICTGSGCIAIAMQTETGMRVDACDISAAALKTAQNNAIANSADVRFFLSDMLDAVTGTYDMIVCNPPYVSEDEYEALDHDVKNHEPKLALVAGDGLDFYRRLATESAAYLSEGGALVLEIGANQGAAVTGLLEEAGWGRVTSKKDYAGRDRIVSARRI